MDEQEIVSFNSFSENDEKSDIIEHINQNFGSGLFEIPESLKNRLYPHQVEGVEWLWKMHNNQYGGALLADDMGLGKTIQVCAYLQCLHNMGQLKSCLIISPASVLPIWEAKIHEWTDLPLIVFHGTRRINETDLAYSIHDSFSIVLSTYGILERYVDFFSEVWKDYSIDGRWDYVILDEGHKIRNQHTGRAQAIGKIMAHHRIMLSGTPIQNNLLEMWSVMDWLSEHRLFGPRESFLSTYKVYVDLGQNRNATPDERVEAEKKVDELRGLIFSMALRREKAIVCKEQEEMKIGKKTEIVLWCRLGNRQIAIYECFLQSERVKEVLSTSKNALASLVVMQKICDHAMLLNKRERRDVNEYFQNQDENEGKIEFEEIFGDGFSESSSEENDPISLNRIEPNHFQTDNVEEDYDEEQNQMTFHEILEKPRKKKKKSFSFLKLRRLLRTLSDEVLYSFGNKMNVVVPLIEELLRDRHKVLVFSKYLKMLYVIDECLSRRNIKTLHYNGTLPPRSREDVLNTFKEEEYEVLLITIGAGGEGITITEADRVIIIDPNWNPTVDDQAIDRAYRIGQKNNVIVYRLVTCSTVEEKMYARQVWKECTNKLVMEHKNILRTFNRSDLEDLFMLQDPQHSPMRKNIAELQLQVNLPEDPDHMRFLSTLDIDGISEHSQLFSLSYDKVNRIISNTIRRRIQNINVREMLGESVFHPLEVARMRDQPNLTQSLTHGHSDHSDHSIESVHKNENLKRIYDFPVPVVSMGRNDYSVSSVKRVHPEKPSDDDLIDLVTSSDSSDLSIPDIVDYSIPRKNPSLNDDYDDSIVSLSDSDPEDDQPVQIQNPPNLTQNTTYSPSRMNDTTIYPVYDDSDSSDESLD